MRMPTSLYRGEPHGVCVLSVEVSRPVGLQQHDQSLAPGGRVPVANGDPGGLVQPIDGRVSMGVSAMQAPVLSEQTILWLMRQ